MSALKVGDVCVIFGLFRSTELNGTICTIKGPYYGPTMCRSTQQILPPEECYWTDASSGVISAENLRRIDDDSPNAMTTWEKCAWQPNKQKERA